VTDRALIYGATGFTGRLITEEAIARGLRPIIAGRSAARLDARAQDCGLACRVAALDDPAALRRMLQDVDVLLNTAGPFQITAPPLVAACIDAGVHYLDITGEFASIERLATFDRRARERGIMLLPGTGFDVVPTDCLAAELAERMPRAESLSIALTGLNAISRGSALSVFAQYSELVMVRRDGRLVRVPPGTLTREVDFGFATLQTTAITWGDIASAYYTTGIPNITVYYEATPLVRLGLSLSRYVGALANAPLANPWRDAAISALPAGPGRDERQRGGASIFAQVTDASGRSAELRLSTPEVYSFTAQTSVAILERVLVGEYSRGFQTPARAYGPDLVRSLPGVR
jgi:short subunit dehydrogenase-like uncharacterized protein